MDNPSKEALLQNGRPSTFLMAVGNRNKVTTKGILVLAYNKRFALSQYFPSMRQMKARSWTFVVQIQRYAAQKAIADGQVKAPPE